MKFDFVKNAKVICFAAGAAAAVVSKKVFTSDKFRKACVSGIAKGMKVQQDAQEALKNMREEAEDICYEARTTLENEEVED